MKNLKTFLFLALVFGFAGAVAVQQRIIQRLKTEAAARPPESAQEIVEDTRAAAVVRPSAPPSNTELSWRVARLEKAIEELARASDYLMERGQLPLAGDKLGDLQRKLSDVNASDRDRLQALRLLRRNNALTDDVVQLAAGWLNSVTNANVREDLLGQLEGRTNAVLREPLLRLAATDPDEDVRQQAVENLSRFAGDAEVDGELWKMLRNESEEDVREEIADALREGPVSEARLASLRERALNAQSTTEERLLAMSALLEAKADASDIAATLAQLAAQSRDPLELVQLYRGFDDVNDPAFVPPLVQGLQDPNPSVRERAADALSDFRSDPKVQEWLRYVAENDADPLVRREAFRGLERTGR
jgi:HEAT repeat protein